MQSVHRRMVHKFRSDLLSPVSSQFQYLADRTRREICANCDEPSFWILLPNRRSISMPFRIGSNSSKITGKGFSS